MEIDTWLAAPFEVEYHDEPLVGFVDLAGLSNLEVLARLVGINGGFSTQTWGDVEIGEFPYGYNGLSSFDEIVLLIALINYGAGVCSGAGEERNRLHDLVLAQINLDNPEPYKTLVQ